jgi:hypothetical protein
MAALTREEYNSAPVIPGNRKVWFLNGDLVRVYHLNKSNGIMSVYNINKDRIESCLIADFKKNRERAYTVGQTDSSWEGHKKNLEQHLLPLVKTGARIIYTNTSPFGFVSS